MSQKFCHSSIRQIRRFLSRSIGSKYVGGTYETKITETIGALNDLQSNYQTLLEQENVQINLPLVKFEYQKQVLKKLNNGALYKALRSIPIIHVAGTKGKGSTCAFIESILRQRGLKTGFFSSPHLVSATERIRINYSPIDSELFVRYFWNVHSQLEKGEHPAYFAFLSLVALEAFVSENVDVIILEVGIGGRYCATNTYPAFDNNNLPGRISCITSLGYDHCSILGNTIEEIAANKCGIFHSFSTNFSSQQPIAASIPVVDRCSFDQSNKPVNFTEPDNLHGIKLGLSGPFQVENAALALAATRHFLQSEFTESDDDLRDFELEGLKNATWPGRSQIVYHVLHERNFKVFLDGAHTAESMLGCYRWMASQNISNLSIIFNITGKRDERPLLDLLAKLNPACIYLSPNIPNHVTSDKTRSRPDQENRVNPLFLQTARLNEIKSTMDSMGIKSVVCVSVTDVFERENLTENILITGSIHLLGAFFQLRPDIVL